MDHVERLIGETTGRFINIRSPPADGSLPPQPPAGGTLAQQAFDEWLMASAERRERMITMMDEIFDRHYQAGRSAFHSGIDGGMARIATALAATFKTLHRIQWNAPWARAKDVGHA